MVRMFDAGLQENQPVVIHDKVWTVANIVTFARLAGLPLFVWLMVGPEAYGMAFLTLVIVGTTDWVDGYIARRFDQVTKLGKVIDPLIDRALLATAALTMLALGIIPVWVVALIVGRDLLLVAAALVLFRGNPQIPVTQLGKFATACLLIGVPGFLLGYMDWAGATVWGAIGWTFTLVGIVAYYVAGFVYAKAAREMIAERGRSGSPESGPPKSSDETPGPHATGEGE